MDSDVSEVFLLWLLVKLEIFKTFFGGGLSLVRLIFRLLNDKNVMKAVCIKFICEF